jgi:GNAT superfamily N-acetyltransferase
VEPFSDAGPVVLRRAVAADARELARLRYRFRAELAPAIEEESDFVERCARWMASRLAAGSVWRCWVAERERRIVAQIWVEIFEKLPNPAGERERHAYLTNFFVAPELRNGGLGRRMLAQAIEWCAGEGVDAVLLRPSDRSRPFYRRAGFDATDEYFSLSLKDRPQDGA